MIKIQVYAEKLTLRLKYVLNYLSGLQADVLFQFHILDSFSPENNINNPHKIWYSHYQPKVDELWIKPNGLLSQKGTNCEPPIIFQHRVYGFKAIYANNSTLGFDVFSAIFFCLSRMEEYSNSVENYDIHGRFKAEASVFANDLNIPWVEYWVELLWKNLSIPIKWMKFKQVITFDIDNAYAFLHHGLIKNMKGAVADIFIRRSVKWYFTRSLTLLQLSNDPYNTHNQIIQFLKNNEGEKIVFFPVGNLGPYDKHLVNFPILEKLIHRYLNVADIGLHPTYNSFVNTDTLISEKLKLEAMVGKGIMCSRQHYLRLQMPQTYQALAKIGILHDYTMGYPEPGFRAQTCKPFKFYDFENEAETNLTLHPLTVMDAGLRFYLKVLPKNVAEYVSPIKNEIEKFGGEYVVCMHNEIFSNFANWEGWTGVPILLL